MIYPSEFQFSELLEHTEHVYFYKGSVRKGSSFCEGTRLNILIDATIIGQQNMNKSCHVTVG